MDPDKQRQLRENAESASRLLKALANQDRLMVLCILADSEKSVSELEDMLGIRQPTLSQQLARLRADDLVSTRRDGKIIYYRLASSNAAQIIETLYAMFCDESNASTNADDSKSKGEQTSADAA